ncbi:Disintegrin and metalloproteinase domain-containing protein B [Sporothrix schenckii 1099-18]|uniref:Disintegrin and metalloproteinase domain-containing protein B n=2 Tax=Sporothrix schenckii TaxID=29908 RepID=U7PLB5_SPOS1|nr:Disintegrin and metalloproteinase domain-containing protein B [Sporothrix schenckii 1099-18]ERS96367.1 hypothetical protein HMPREF1624_07277 [Sporothrix schenckii ATCC 58251]KJR87092.1 Disintegrin and metalloproteinase domain-containing protein B [Sporothrix schenckii 1099-18]
MRNSWRPRPGGSRGASSGPQRHFVSLKSTCAVSLSRPFAFLLTTLLALSCLISGVHAESRPRNPLRTIARIEDAVLHAPSHRVHALSHFQISLTLHQEDSGRRLPVRLRLEPNHNILADDAAIHHMNADGTIVVEKINRLDHRVFMGHAFVQTGHGLVDGNINDNHWINAGYASVYIHADGDRPIFEGAFHLAGDHHHIQTNRNFLHTRVAGDPVIGYETDEFMVVWRDSDILPDAAMLDVELRRRLMQRGLDSTPVGNDTIDGRSLLAPGCVSDGLAFNQDALHPIYSGMDIDRYTDIVKRASGSVASASSGRWLFGRQIDGTGGTGGNAGGINLASTIGNPSGCPTARKVALMGIAADCNYWNLLRDNTTDNIVAQVNAASRVYENTFNISLGIQHLLIQNNSCPSDASTTATPWNAACGLSITDRLNLFSKWRGESANDNNAFWMLLSTCATDSAVGLAWLGQLCVPGSQSSGSQTIAATNVVIRTSTEWQVMAHEIGHTFGAVHDCTSQTCSDGTSTKQQCCPLSASNCNANGAFIMNPSTGIGITQFSSCTLGNICSAMRRNSVKSSCLSNNKDVVTVTGSECGNGIVEAGEDCDCGGVEGCGSNSCCNPTTCKFTANALCDPSNDECCTPTCQLAGSGTVCRPSTGSCDPAETCSGTSAACPSDVTSPDGMTCGASGSGLTCASGQCTSRNLQCKTLMGSLTTSNDTYACSSQGCQLSCASPEFGPNTCLSMNQNFLDGTPCQGGGHCNNGNCEGVSLSKEIAELYRNNLAISIPVTVVVGILVLLLFSTCLCSIAKGRRRRRHLRQLARMGMPPPPVQPRSPGWLFGLGGKRLSKNTNAGPVGPAGPAGPAGPPGPGATGAGVYGTYRGYAVGGAPGATNVAQNVPAADGAPRSRWAFWRSSNTGDNTNKNTSAESVNVAQVPPAQPRSLHDDGSNSATPSGNLPPSVGPWRMSGYGGGPGGPGAQGPPLPPAYDVRPQPQQAPPQWMTQSFQAPRYA